MSIVTIKEIGGDNIHLEQITVTGSVVQERIIEHVSTLALMHFPGHADYAPATINNTLIEIIDRKANISDALPIGGTSSDFLSGDRTWKPITKNTVGLNNVDDTSDLNKPISNATQIALNNKEDTILTANSNYFFAGDKTWKPITKNTVGLSNVDDTSDLNKPISNATQIALNNKENTILTANPNYFFAGDKTWKPITKNTVGLDQLTNDTQLKLADLDIDATLSANSDTKIPSQRAVKTFVDTHHWDAGTF